MLYTQTFLEIRELLKIPVLEHVHKYHEVGTLSIHDSIKKLKDTDPEKYKKIIFGYNCRMSDHVSEVMTDLIRHCMIKETRNGYVLTGFGESLIKDNEGKGKCSNCDKEEHLNHEGLCGDCVKLMEDDPFLCIDEDGKLTHETELVYHHDFGWKSDEDIEKGI